MPLGESIQPAVDLILFILRILTPILSILILCGCFLSLKRGRRREEPVVLLEDTASGLSIPVLYWENSIGRSKSCDIVLPDSTVSRDHAVLMRRESGWMITDTNSKAGTMVNGKPIQGRARLVPGDVISIGSSSLMLKRVTDSQAAGTGRGRATHKMKRPPVQIKRAPSPGKLMAGLTLVQIFLTVQCCLAAGQFSWQPLISFAALLVLSWGMFLVSTKAMHRGQL